MFLQVVTVLLVITAASGDNFDRVCSDLVSHYRCSDFQHKTLCGSDGKVYHTECDFAKAHCNHRYLSIINEGPCVKVTTVGKATAVDTSVAASTTPATLINTNKVTNTMPATQRVSTPVTAEGSTMLTTVGTTLDPIKCQVLTMAKCPTGGSRVCGTDSVTYDNSCEFEKKKCQNPSINISKDGPCDQFILCRAILASNCEKDPNPVCGDDGVTYNNLCEHQKVKCSTQPKLQVAYNGSCRPAI